MEERQRSRQLHTFIQRWASGETWVHGFTTVSTLSLPILTAIFPGEPGLAGFIAAKDDGLKVMVTTAATGRAKLQSNSHYQQTNTQLRPDVLPVTQPTVSKH